MKVYGLIGYPLEHSFSQKYFSEKFSKEGMTDCRYENFPLESIRLLPELIAGQPELRGLNVTIPYKQEVIAFLDNVDAEARAIGAVNTIRIERKHGRTILRGFNTDVHGFEEPLLKVRQPIHTSALILGTGGASKAVAHILKKHNIHAQYVSRNPKSADILGYNQLSPELIRRTLLIVNCSPVGMHPHIDVCPELPYEAVTGDHILYDLIYNPEKTLFLRKGEEKKATLINGLPMLYIQAEKAWEIWNSE